MDFIRLSRGQFYVSNQIFQIGWQISDIKVIKTYKYLAQYLYNNKAKNTGTWFVKTAIIVHGRMLIVDT